MNYDDIISRFDSIQELHISEEDIGAYIEGGLDSENGQRVHDYISSDLFWKNLEYDINTQDNINSCDISLPESLEVDEMELPQLTVDENLSINENLEDYKNVSYEEVSYGLFDGKIESEDEYTIDDIN